MIRLSRARTRAVALEAAIVLLFTVVAYAMTSPLLARAQTHIADMGVNDTLLYTRYARCFRDWLLGREPGYLNFDFYFPSLLAGATDDAALGISVQALPVSLFVRDYLFTINLVTFASFVMCAHAAYLLTRELTTSRGAGIVAGFAFAFCFYRMRQLDHPHVLQMQWLPYALFFMHRLASDPSRRNGLIFTVFLFFACTASFNIAIYSLIAFPFVGTWLVVTTRRNRLRVIGWLAFAAAVVGVLMLQVYRPFFILRDTSAPIRTAAEIRQFSSRLESFYAAPAFSARYGDLAKNMSDECATFLGWSVLVLASVGLFGLFPRSPRFKSMRVWPLVPVGFARACALAAGLILLSFFAIFDDWAQLLLLSGIGAAIIFALQRTLFQGVPERVSPAPIYAAIGLIYAAFCFGPEITSRTHDFGPGLWVKIQSLPGFEQVRTPSRFFFVSSLCAAVLAGMGVRAVTLALPGKIAKTIFVVAAAGAVLWDLRTEPIPIRPMPTRATAPPIYDVLAHAPKPGAVVEFPATWFEPPSQKGDAGRRMYYANIFARPTMNGVSGWGMYYFNQINTWSKQEDGSVPGFEALRVAHIAGLRYVVLHANDLSVDDRALYADAVGRLGGSLSGIYGSAALYELPDPPPSRPATAADLEVHFKTLDWRDRSARDVFVRLEIENRTGENLYDRAVQHFSVDATAAGVTVGTGNGSLAPPLFAPHQIFPTQFRMTLIRRPRPDWVEVHITDDGGHLWGTSRMKLPD